MLDRLRTFERVVINVRWLAIALSCWLLPGSLKYYVIIAVLYNLVGAYLVHDRTRYKRSWYVLATVTRLMDTILITVAIWVAGGAQPGIYLMYAFVIINTALVFETFGALLATLASAFLYDLCITFAPWGEQLPDRMSLLALRAIVLLVLGLVSTYVARIARVERERRTSLQRSATLYEVGKATTATLDLDRLLDLVLDAAVLQTGAEKSSLMLLDAETNCLRISKYRGLSQEVAARVRIQRGEGIAGWVLEHNEPVLLGNLKKDPRFQHLGGQESVCSALSVPLRLHNEVIGVLNVSTTDKVEAFTNADLELLTALSSHAAITISNAQLYQQVQEEYLSAIHSLANSLDSKDPYTHEHSTRVTDYAVAIAEHLKLSPEDVDGIRTIGLLHDIGKIGIEDSILNKPGKLTDEEYESIKRHPFIGEKSLRPIESLKTGLSLVRSHHERVDGKGYPDGLVGDQLPLPVRILGVADSYDALTSDRPYRKALSQEEAFRELRRCSGSQFDTDVVEAFIEVLTQDTKNE